MHLQEKRLRIFVRSRRCEELFLRKQGEKLVAAVEEFNHALSHQRLTSHFAQVYNLQANHGGKFAFFRIGKEIIHQCVLAIQGKNALFGHLEAAAKVTGHIGETTRLLIYGDGGREFIIFLRILPDIYESDVTVTGGK